MRDEIDDAEEDWLGEEWLRNHVAFDSDGDPICEICGGWESYDDPCLCGADGAGEWA